MKRKIGWLVVLLVVVCCLALVACQPRNNNETEGPNGSDPTTQGSTGGSGQTGTGGTGGTGTTVGAGEATRAGTYVGLGSNEALYGMGAVTTAQLLAASLTGSSPQQAAGPAPSGTASAVQSALNEGEDFNRYFNMLDTFLDKVALSTVVEVNSSAQYPDYAFKLTVVGKDIEGADVTHVMYYNETQVRTVDKPRETLRMFALEGVYERAGADPFYLTGTRTEEHEWDGREEEVSDELILRAGSVPGNHHDYVELKAENETETEGGVQGVERSYEYRVYRAGRLVEASEVEVENEGAETEYEIKFLTGASHGTYQLERVEAPGATYIRVTYAIDNERGAFVITRDGEGAYVYQYDSDNRRTYRNYQD